MGVKLYWSPVSHPAQAARKMLELKGIEFQPVEVKPGMQRIHLRLAGFRDGTVPALKLDGRRVQGSRRISRALEQLVPEPPLFPRDPALRTRVDDAEAWGERELQPVPRRIIRWARGSAPGSARQIARSTSARCSELETSACSDRLAR